MICSAALALAICSAQEGYPVAYRRQPSSISYTFEGHAVSTYVGAIDAPPTRQVDILGTLVLRTESRGGKWVVVADTKGLKVLVGKKPASASNTKLAMKGVWSQVVGGAASYLADGKAVLPTQLNSPLWPIFWMPIAPDKAMKLGDEYSQKFSFPAQAFLEDDPIGRFELPLTFAFNGPEYPTSDGKYSFTLRSAYDVDQPVKHPEDPNLVMKGHVLVDGRFKTDRKDGRLESANTIMSVDLWLEGKNYPFGFSKAKGSVTADLQRIK